MDLRDRYRGALVGLAAGDALGTPLEFTQLGAFEPIADMIGGGPWNLAPGEWTDDTSMAICLAESLIECRGFDPEDQLERYVRPEDQLERYVRWFREGHLSSTGYCVDIGSTVAESLLRFEHTGEPYCGSTDPYSAGNGCIMRLAPVPLYYARDPRQTIERSGERSRTTHGTNACIDACRYLGALIVGALTGTSKKELLSPHYSPVPGYWDEYPLVGEIHEIAAGSFKRREPPGQVPEPCLPARQRRPRDRRSPR